MATVTKHYCDRCGKDMGKHYDTVQLNPRTLFDHYYQQELNLVSRITWIICKDCLEKVIKFIEKNKDNDK